MVNLQLLCVYKCLLSFIYLFSKKYERLMWKLAFFSGIVFFLCCCDFFWIFSSSDFGLCSERETDLRV